VNLIERLGGYEAAKAEGEKWGFDDFLNNQLLEYRRQHNIFEVGDKVVHPKFSNMNIYEICEIKGDLFTVFYDRKSHSFKSDVRHATDEEIKAGKRLEVKSEN
jgi:hypothetical protein